MPEVRPDPASVGDVSFLLTLVDRLNVELDKMNKPVHASRENLEDRTEIFQRVLELGEQMQQVADRIRR